jgi:hypothetical protein
MGSGADKAAPVDRKDGVATNSLRKVVVTVTGA